ncbi:hypothetical protein Taro_005150 [Colocasia esculenta]|uniref:Uncharacterized protein n=1 Tax=Colocasia esculenta TaxID=4460 RepID=A0A843TRL1_COLES|nr:hypothetical protein [Colocasia esculenta]
MTGHLMPVRSGRRVSTACQRSEVAVLAVRRRSHLVVPWSRQDRFALVSAVAVLPQSLRCAERCFRFVLDSVGFCGSRFLLLWLVRDW